MASPSRLSSGDDAASTASLQSASRPSFSRDVLVSQEAGDDHPIVERSMRATVTVVGSKPIESVRIELSTESDLFFLLEAEYNPESYAALQKEQDLTIDFDQFPVALSDIFTSASSREGEFRLRLTGDDEPVLTVIENLKFKTLTVFRLRFARPPDEKVKESIQERYEEVCAQLATVRHDLLNFYGILKIRNPSVLKQVKTSRK
jgi:hypothetical protein